MGGRRGYTGGPNGAKTMAPSKAPTDSDGGNDGDHGVKAVRPRTPPRERARRNPKATRASILAAARSEFAENGLNGGRVDKIAKSAGINKQLVYYYFGSKDELYKCALEATYQEIRTREHELDLSLLSPREAMIRLVDFSLNYLNEHRDFIRLLADENAHGARHLNASSMAVKTNSPLLELIGQTLERGEAEGVFRPGVDALELYVSIAGMTFFYFSNGLTLSAIFGRDLTTKEAVASYRDHIVTLVLEGLRR
jgi:TetR/AcrR family transcriptional regulator